MVHQTKTKLFDEVVAITHEYFGLAADRFVARQIRNHLHKDPEQLRKQDLAALIKWISLAMALITDDEKLIKKYTTNLQAMANLSKN
jgi:hypothetical protein